MSLIVSILLSDSCLVLNLEIKIMRGQSIIIAMKNTLNYHVIFLFHWKDFYSQLAKHDLRIAAAPPQGAVASCNTIW